MVRKPLTGDNMQNNQNVKNLNEQQERAPWSRPQLQKLEMAQTAGVVPGVGEGTLGNYT